MHNLALARELLRLLKALEDGGVPVLPYKGPALAEMAYGDATLRYCTDLDILVRPQDVDKARLLLGALGYELSDEFREHEAAYRHTHHHYVLSRPGSKVPLELHWALVTRQFSFHLTFAALHGRSFLLPLAGHPVRSPSVEDMLIICCIHASMHGWKHLKDVCDVAELVRRRPLAWDAALRRARSLGAARMVYLGLALAGSFLGAAIPPEAAAAVQADSEVPFLLADVCRGPLAVPSGEGRGPEIRSFWGYHVRLRERRRDRIEESPQRAFTPNVHEWDALHLPERLAFLQYVIRPLRPLWRYAGTAVRKVMR